MKITVCVRLVSVSVHDIYSSAFFISHSRFFVSVSVSSLRLPDIVPCHSAERKKNLMALTNKVSWDRQQLQGNDASQRLWKRERHSDKDVCEIRLVLNTSLSISATQFRSHGVHLGVGASLTLEGF